MAIAPGTKLGRYRLTERAGAGGMSEVWKAEDETLHRTVAVKVILGPIASDATYRDRFLREARLVAGLEHPNILPVYDFGTETVEGSELPFLVMPLVSGGSLKERIRGPVPPAQAVAWLAAVGSALDHAHAKGILHRDIKPGNVLMGAGDRPLLADFGLARAVESASGLTQTGTVLGTPLYMAPEQAMGKPLDARADQYALAVIAFEMLSGRVPFQADSPLAVLHQHVAVPPPPVTANVPGLPAEADGVLTRALAKSAADRYATCLEFVASLAQALGVPLSAATSPISFPPAPPSLPRAVPPPPPADSGISQQATIVAGPPPVPAAVSGAMAAPASRAAGPRRGLRIALPLVAAALGIAVVFGILKGRKPETTVAQLPPTAAPTVIPPTIAAPEPTIAPTVAPVTPPTAVPTPAAVEPTAAPVPTAARPVSHADDKKWERDVKAPGASTFPRGSPEERFGERPRVTAGGDAPLPHREPLLLQGASADTTLGAAYRALDTSRRPDGRLTRADFVNAMGEARGALARRRSADAVFLDAFARAGVAYADGQRIQAWQLLHRAFESDPGAASSRTLRFVHHQAIGLGPNPGPDADWLMGLAFGDARGDLAEELERAAARDASPAVLYAQALHAVDRRDPAAHGLARRACDGGLREACDLAH